MKLSKKFVLALLFIALFTGSAFARHKLGMISLSNTDPEKFGEIALKIVAAGDLDFFGNPEPATYAFYDNLNTLMMALNQGDIDEMMYPDMIGDFVVRFFPNREVKCVRRNAKGNFSFAFAESNKELRDEFNNALKLLRGDMTLTKLADEYYKILDPGTAKATEFEKFEGAKTIKIAITGDIPPIDMITADGKAMGFNTAVLSEIAKILKINIELINIESNARAAALASGRADVIFWCLTFQDERFANVDTPEGIITSDPYFTWNSIVHVGLKNK